MARGFVCPQVWNTRVAKATFSDTSNQGASAKVEGTDRLARYTTALAFSSNARPAVVEQFVEGEPGSLPREGRRGSRTLAE